MKTVIARAAAIAVLAVAATVPIASQASAHACGIAFKSNTERVWVQRVHRRTDLNCRQARYIYRNEPGWRDEMPGNIYKAAGANPVPNPASAPTGGTLTTTRYCRVWNLERYRAPIVPFGNHVLWTVRMEQVFGYDGNRIVSIGRPRVTTDTTANGFRWFADGPPWGNDWWTPIWARIQHTSERWQKMGSWSIPQVGSTHSTAYLRITVRGDGYWEVDGKRGLPGCQNP
jgi:hypothetical protein